MKFIFKVRMKPGHSIDEYAEGWITASEIIQQGPGARGTYLHRSLHEPNVALAIAQWESKKQRDEKNDRDSSIVADILDKHKTICDIEVIGEFADAEWSVLPPLPSSATST